MSVYHEGLWKKLEEKAMAEDEGQPEQAKCGHAYLAAVRGICDTAVSLASTIRDVFPLYTLHDETHICNVMRLMEKLLGGRLELLSRDEAAMLVLAACCHDIGMSCSPDQARELLEERDRLEQYLEDHPDAPVGAGELGDLTRLPDGLLRDFLRTVHAGRANDILLSTEWPDVLQGKVNRQDLSLVCQSHGENADRILELRSEYGVDLCMCAVLLRLADILDFDTSRAPQAVYRYSGFDSREDPAARFSREEWEKHRASHGFFFERVENRAYPYELPYHAACPSMQVEQAVNSYLDWVDQELTACQGALRYCGERWRGLVLPRKIARRIDPEGYLSGQFCLTLDQDRVLELLAGKNLYQDPGVFVRELLQNAIDAVRTRQQLDRNLPRDWSPRISVRCWMDEEGYHWFRMEDNGTGMNEDIIKKYFLKVGCSYYASSDFQKEKCRYQADADYMPISRFGIGILSCFMGDKAANRVEISTKHFARGSAALRMSMHGISGYYYLASRAVCPRPAPMKGVTPEEKRAYRGEAGTAIAVRTNLYQSGKYRSFREILDQYVAYPTVPVHYEDEDGSFDYPTEQDLMAAIHGVHPSEDPEQRGVLEFSPTDQQIRDLEGRLPGLVVREKPKVILKCVALDRDTQSPNLSGAVLLAKVAQGESTCVMRLGEESVRVMVDVGVTRENHQLVIRFSLGLSKKFQQRVERGRTQQEVAESRCVRLMSRADSPLKLEILDGIGRGYDRSRHWRQRLRGRFCMSEAELSKAIASVWAEVEEDDLSASDIAAYRDYEKAASQEKAIVLCDLRTLPWYRRFFVESRGVRNHVSLTAHNGVFCGHANFLVSDLYRSMPSEAILLLKDRYRPEVDLARTGVQHLPLDAAVELEIFCAEWRRQGFDVARADSVWGDDWMIPYRAYCELIEERPDLVGRLYFETGQGSFRAAELPEKLREFGRLELTGCPPIAGPMARRGNLHRYFAMAYLQKEFRLTGMFHGIGGSVFLLPKQAAGAQPRTADFPPNFFLPAAGSQMWLTSGSSVYRFFCNENHPLSKFLIDSQPALKKIVPGLYHELMHSLASDDRTKMIPRVNGWLRQIQSLPQGKIRVPADAFLKEEDFP